MRNKLNDGCWAVVFNLIADLIWAFLGTLLGSWWQSLLEIEKRAGLALNPLASFIVALPPWVIFVAILLLTLFFAPIVAVMRHPRRLQSAATQFPARVTIRNPLSATFQFPAHVTIRKPLLQQLLDVIRKRPNVSGDILTFKMVDWQTLRPDEFAELEADMRRPGFSGNWWFVHLELVNSGAPSRVKNFRFITHMTDGTKDYAPHPVSKRWSVPSTWPQIRYYTLDEIRAEYLTRNVVYNVFFLLITSVLTSERNLKMLEIIFDDDFGKSIVCRT